MELLSEVIRWEIQIFILALAGLTGLKLLSREINTSGLLYGRISGRKRGQDQYFSPERVQLLIFTVGGGLYYLSLVLNNPDPGVFPAIPDSWPMAMGGSNVIYLGGKAYARWIARRFGS